MSPETDFIQADEKAGLVTVKVNPEVFPIDLIYSAAYSMMDRAYIVLDGSPHEMIYAILKPRRYDGELEDLGTTFYDELIASAFEAVQIVRNKGLREALFETLSGGGVSAAELPASPEAELPETDEGFDEEDIATIWQEKFGDKSEGSEEEG